jgi:hypothetical protein
MCLFARNAAQSMFPKINTTVFVTEREAQNFVYCIFHKNAKSKQLGENYLNLVTLVGPHSPTLPLRGEGKALNVFRLIIATRCFPSFLVHNRPLRESLSLSL